MPFEFLLFSIRTVAVFETRANNYQFTPLRAISIPDLNEGPVIMKAQESQGISAFPKEFLKGPEASRNERVRFQVLSQDSLPTFKTPARAVNRKS
jgi:hypothetical protein